MITPLQDILPHGTADRVIAYRGDAPLTLGAWRARVQALAAQLAAQPAASYLLVHHDTVHFATGLFALLHATERPTRHTGRHGC